MDKCGNGQPDPDPYQLLGVARQADQSEIAQAWRRRVRAEHPDAQPGDVGAPARFRALARAYEMLSDPAAAPPTTTRPGCRNRDSAPLARRGRRSG